ncbi:uncharacterized protein LOC132713940 [Ruditapes philippinarum]|uniref:uncharacterized protein LOC132713940 n=1 Tax=Ruditapes philippinarum TaxID=129788 RepID=UPI00295B3EFD|nr:uncharacterized protein LOC132713940 [Ruditapes philippinarum]
MSEDFTSHSRKIRSKVTHYIDIFKKLNKRSYIKCDKLIRDGVPYISDFDMDDIYAEVIQLRPSSNNSLLLRSMAMSLGQSFKESGSDEARDNEDDTEVCSYCATDGKLQPASYFCYNCGVFGRYICGRCLTHHNRTVKSHKVKLMSNQHVSRGQTLETELDKERKNVEELRHKLDDKMKQIQELEKALKDTDEINKHLAVR